MIKAGEAGGALEVILQRLADFKERAESLKRKVKSAMIYPVVVVCVAVGILTFIMIKIVPSFQSIFEDFDLELPVLTVYLINVANWCQNYWYLIPGIPIAIWLTIKLIRKFKHGRIGWDQFIIKMPIFGQLIEKNIMARTSRTLGTLIASGVPILEALNITRETAGNAIFEKMFSKISERIREGDAIAAPMKEYSRLSFHPVAAFFWFCFIGGPIGLLMYMLKYRQRVVDDIVVNMVDVGEETGELDTMLYKVADTYDEEVAVLTDGLTKLMEPLLIIFLGGAVGFIVIALFVPLVDLINNLSG
jgi:type IV pilus assembly protein PilC